MSSCLKAKLEKISRVFDIEKLLEVRADKNYIRSYYSKNKIPYSIFHTKQNFVHMGISRDGKFKNEDLLEHVKLVDNYIRESAATNVLELASGRGANSLWLAEKHPATQFRGIDLSTDQISFAKRDAIKYKNFAVTLGDFHNLAQFGDSIFDVVFVIEALCHSSKTSEVLSEVHRVLKTGGYFVVFDGYLGNKNLSDEEQLAAKITGRGMAVDGFLKYSDFKEQAGAVSLGLVMEENLSPFVVPTMKRFERLAKMFFKYPNMAKLLARLLPKEFTYNSVSGLLMPILFDHQVFEYWVTVFKK